MNDQLRTFRKMVDGHSELYGYELSSDLRLDAMRLCHLVTKGAITEDQIKDDNDVWDIAVDVGVDELWDRGQWYLVRAAALHLLAGRNWLTGDEITSPEEAREILKERTKRYR